MVEYEELRLNTANSGQSTTVTTPLVVTDNGGLEGMVDLTEGGELQEGIILQQTFTLEQDTSVFADVRFAPRGKMKFTSDAGPTLPIFAMVLGERTIKSFQRYDSNNANIYPVIITLADDSQLDSSDILLTSWSTSNNVNKEVVVSNQWFPAGTVITIAYELTDIRAYLEAYGRWYNREGFQVYFNPSDTLTVEGIPMKGFFLDSTVNNNVDLLKGSVVKDCDCSRMTMDGADLSVCRFVNCDMNHAFLKNIVTDATTEFDEESLSGLQLNISGADIKIPEAYQVVEGYVCGPRANLSNLGDLLLDAALDIDLAGAQAIGTNLSSLDPRKQSNSLNMTSYYEAQTIPADNKFYGSWDSYGKISGDGNSLFIMDPDGQLNVFVRPDNESEYSYDSTVPIGASDEKGFWRSSTDGTVVGATTSKDKTKLLLWEKTKTGWAANMDFQNTIQQLYENVNEENLSLSAIPSPSGDKVLVLQQDDVDVAADDRDGEGRKIILFNRSNGFTEPLDEVLTYQTTYANYSYRVLDDLMVISTIDAKTPTFTGLVDIYKITENKITLINTIPHRQVDTAFGIDVQLSEDGTKMLVMDYFADTLGENSGRLDFFETTDGWQSYTEIRNLFGYRAEKGLGIKNRVCSFSGDGKVIVIGGTNIESAIPDLPLTRLEHIDGKWTVTNTIRPTPRLDLDGNSIAFDNIMALDPSADTLILSYEDNVHVVHKYGLDAILSPTQDMTANGFLISTGDLSDTFEASNYAAFLSSENKLNEAFLKDVADLKPARPVVFGSDFLDAISSLTFAPNVQVITAKHGPRQWNDEIYVGYIILESGESFKFQNISTSLRRTLDGVYEIYEGDEFQRILSQGQLYSSDTLDIAFGSIIVIARISLRDICFAKGSIVETDQGPTRIERIRPWYHTIDGEVIDKLVQSLCVFPSVVQIEKDALGENYPNRLTVVTPNHKIEYKGNMLHAGLLRHLPGVRLIDSNQRRMYNIFLKEYSFMKVNNLKAETLYPESLYKLQNTMV